MYTYNCALPGSLCDNLSSKYQKRGAVQDSVEWRVVRAVPGHQLSVTSLHLHGGDLLPIRGDLLPIRNLSLFMKQLARCVFVRRSFAFKEKAAPSAHLLCASSRGERICRQCFLKFGHFRGDGNSEFGRILGGFLAESGGSGNFQVDHWGFGQIIAETRGIRSGNAKNNFGGLPSAKFARSQSHLRWCRQRPQTPRLRPRPAQRSSSRK